MPIHSAHTWELICDHCPAYAVYTRSTMKHVPEGWHIKHVKHTVYQVWCPECWAKARGEVK